MLFLLQLQANWHLATVTVPCAQHQPADMRGGKINLTVNERERKSSGNKRFPEERVDFCITLHSRPHTTLLDARVPRLRSLIWLKTAGGQGEDYRESGEQHASCVHTLLSGGSHAIVFYIRFGLILPRRPPQSAAQPQGFKIHQQLNKD